MTAADLSVESTSIPGLMVLRVPVHRDSRGWFKENWQREKMTALGLPDFGPVQHNVAFNDRRGVTRGVHTEPWDKLVSVASGRVFGAWVDMREGPTYGTSFHLEIDPSTAVFVPRGVGNSYQVLEDGTAYSYLVNDHYRAGVTYPALDLADETAAIPWPIPLTESVISDKDQHNPKLSAAASVPPRRILILGADGQLGRALRAVFPDAEAAGRSSLDIADHGQVEAWPWHDYDVVLNAAAWTGVDAAETPDGRQGAWLANAGGPAALARAAAAHHFTLVHYSSDYVFDGTRELHVEDEPMSPLGVYGQSKAAGDIAVASAPRHYLIRTSWVVGCGHNFVRAMRQLAESRARPTVVADQIGRLTFADELARATEHLLDRMAPYGTYNVTNGGDPMSWADVARRVFELSGRPPGDVLDTTTAAWAADQTGLVAARPRHSTLDLARLRATGFEPTAALEALARHVAEAAN